MDTAKDQVKSFVAGLSPNAPLGDETISQLASGLFQNLPSHDMKALISSVTTQMPQDDKKDVAQKTVSQLPDEAKANVVKQTVEGLPDAARKALVPVIGPPADTGTIDFIWKVIVSTFSIVLLLTVGALIVGMFREQPADPTKVVGTKPELILAIITSVIGFLAGLVSPSPVQK